MTKGTVSVDLASPLILASSELEAQAGPDGQASHVLWILSPFRDQSQGKLIMGIACAIRNTAEQCMSVVCGL
jgi:hypothetical protein